MLPRHPPACCCALRARSKHTATAAAAATTTASLTACKTELAQAEQELNTIQESLMMQLESTLKVRGSGGWGGGGGGRGAAVGRRPALPDPPGG